ncbi:MAG: BamA/TamA family outer membrane protein [Bacteroidetes bacterium]|jgi:WD40 repeat protein|nr:BamA/TamA family outer membrane protein [Bacteroidota bacterium]
MGAYVMMRRWLAAAAVVACLGGAAQAQFYYFGRNKVQYTDFSWHVLRTEHFHIYYYEGMEDLARRGAAVAEEAYLRLEERFNHSISHPIPLIFYSSHLHFQQTNTTSGFIPEGVGGFFEFLKGRVVIPSNGSSVQFAHVIRHELVHVFTMSKFNRVLTDHRAPLDRIAPLWFTEGLAEYWSTTWDTQADLVVRDAVMNNYVPGTERMYRIAGTYLMYKLGQNVCEFIARRFGEEKLLLLFENVWKAKSWEEVWKQTLGVDYEEFDQLWLYDLQKRYYPLLTDQDLPSAVTRKLVDRGFNAKPVVHASDGGRRVYYVGNLLGYTSIYRIDPEAEEPEPELVVKGEQSHELEAFHPFQSKLSLTADGRMAFVTKTGETDALHIYDTRAGSFLETYRFRDLVVIGSPSWAPDGQRLVFSSIDRSGDQDLYLFDVRGDRLKKLTNDLYDDRDPAWSPDGRTIAFSSDRTSYGPKGRYNLFTVDTTGVDIRYVTFGDATDHAPAWSPDGRWLAFTSDVDGVNNIWAVDMTAPEASRSMRRVTSFITSSSDPAWGGRDDLVCTVYERGTFQIRSIEDVAARLDTAEVRPIPAPDRLNGWQPERLSGAMAQEPINYTKEYSLDLAQSQISTDPVFGTIGGAALAMSDLLGNDIYTFLIYNTAQVQSEILDNFNVAISRMSLGSRVNHAYGIFRFAGNRYDLTDPNLFYYERSFGGYFVLSYPLSRFRRVEAGVTVSNSDKDIYVEAPRRALLVSNSLSYIWDTSLWGPSGPVDGRRMKLTLAYTDDIQYANVSYYSIIADYREYLRLTTRSAWALRGHIWYNEGIEARRFFMGGSWDLRGWPRWSIRGQKLWMASQELRFPFVDEFTVRLPFVGIGFGSIRGALYTDVGGAWDDVYRDTKGSIGAGVRMNLGGVIVLRYDIGKRVEQDLRKLQKGLYYQFFFGWDF